jgi:hypothetical protein
MTILLKSILNIAAGVDWIHLDYDGGRGCTVASCCEYGNELSDSMKCYFFTSYVAISL